MTPEEAIQYFNDEIRLCRAAPYINGCQMTDDWQRTIDACEIAVAAIGKVSTLDMARGERDIVTKRMVELEQEVCRLKARLAAYEDTGLEPEAIADAVIAAKLMARSKIVSCFGVDADHVRELVEADQDGRLVVLPCGTDVDLVRDGHAFKADHWNHTLTAFRDAPGNKSGKQVAIFSIDEAEAALAQEGGTHEDSGSL